VATTVSQPVRIAAVLGLAAALALGGAFMLLGRKPSAAPHVAVVPHHPAHASTATTPSATHAATHAASKTSTGSAKTGSAATSHAATQPSAEVAAIRAGLPVKIAHALGLSPVVVVELTDPQSEVDGIAFAEARAGAAMGHAGFVALNVLDKADIGSLTEQLGELLPDPGVLVYTRPAKLAVRLDGFADKETVAQAAVNAASGL
jgi:hypothetical protein